MKHLTIAVLAIAASGGAWAAPEDFRCFRTKNTSPPIFLQFEFPRHKDAVGYVSYRRGSGRIPVRLVATETMETSPDRPLEFTTTWKETGQGGAPGTYTMVTQGARVYGFTFVRGKDKREFEFEEDLAAADGPRCAWRDR